MSTRAWVDLDNADFRNMLISLIGYRFGDRPEERLEEIRQERSDYALRFLKMAAVGSADTVLELGSGCGFGTAAIAAKVGRVIACDISPAYLEYARRECSGVSNVSFREISSRDLSGIEENSIDTVVSVSVFIHLNLYDVYQYFLEFQRILKPRGRVIFDFADMNRLFGSFRSHGNNELFRDHAKFYADDPSALPALVQWNSARGISGVAKAAGFKRLKKRGHRLLFSRLS